MVSKASSYSKTNCFQSQWKLALIIKNGVDGHYGRLKSKKATGEGFGDLYDDVLTKIRQRLMAHDFVMNVALIPYTENLAWTKWQNFDLSSLKSLSVFMYKSLFPSWIDIGLTQSTSANLHGNIYSVLCDPKKIDSMEQKRQMVVNVLKRGDDVASLDTYEHLLTKLHSKIKTHIFSMGRADSDYWDKVAIHSYKSRATFCEMTTSEQYQEVLPFKKTGYLDAHTYMATQILECKEKIQTCSPVYD